MVEIRGYFVCGKKSKAFQVRAINVFDVMKRLAEEAEKYDEDADLCFRIGQMLKGLIADDRKAVNVVFKYSNVLSRNEFYPLWQNFMNTFRRGVIL